MDNTIGACQFCTANGVELYTAPGDVMLCHDCTTIVKRGILNSIIAMRGRYDAPWHLPDTWADDRG